MVALPCTSTRRLEWDNLRPLLPLLLLTLQVSLTLSFSFPLPLSQLTFMVSLAKGILTNRKRFGRRNQRAFVSGRVSETRLWHGDRLRMTYNPEEDLLPWGGRSGVVRSEKGPRRRESIGLEVEIKITHRCAGPSKGAK